MAGKATKVFCIGFQKTGTTSMNRALTTLGYRVTSYFGVSDANIAVTMYDGARERIRNFDAFEDMPWPILFRDLDLWEPGSKFILTLRDPDEWYKSVLGHFGESQTEMRKMVYGPDCGSPMHNETAYKDRYNRHNREVLEYFEGRPDDLLVLRLEEGLDWDRLCGFLGEPKPAAAFPKSNTKSQRRLTRIKSVVRKALGR